ncbi:MAG: Gfo/Idh/MocA family oxidoreductase [Ruthenibacterium lactatiformans]|nr:Gfo/Idh/MocA family oxidoreductase [Ruthenibacterium lactatiformans]MEE1463776.1 Gfo/Idh/MocA family oxidoreductase [Ruthenibacterium lactatiformans]
MCDLHNRVNPPFALARQRIAGGELGEVRSLYMRMNDACSVATEMLSWAKESSILWFVGVHSLDLLCFLSGSRPRKVYAMSTRGVLDSMGVPAVDLYQTSIEMENGTIAQMENGWIVPDGSPALIDMKCTVLCRRGMVKINGSDSDLLRVYSPQRMETPSCIARPEINDRVAGFAVDNLCCFAQGLLESRPFNSTLQEAADVCFAIGAIHESARLHRPVEVQYS